MQQRLLELELLQAPVLTPPTEGQEVGRTCNTCNTCNACHLAEVTFRRGLAAASGTVPCPCEETAVSQDRLLSVHFRAGLPTAVANMELVNGTPLPKLPFLAQTHSMSCLV